MTGGVLTPMISRDARVLVGPHSGAHKAVMNRVVLEPGEANMPHAHPLSEDTIFILEGEGDAVDYDRNESVPFAAPAAILVPAGVTHSVRARTRVVSVGGPVPADLGMLRMLGLA